MPITRSEFPEDFLWGSATASYQIEGAVAEEGRGESIWDRFSHTPGKTYKGETGDRACDHYHRWQEDIALMRDLGLPAYRYSVAWPRIFPDGRGRLEQRGLDFYRRLNDQLMENGIEPSVTLYHWDLPQKLQDIGGWTHPDLPLWFGDYAAAMYEGLGPNQAKWITLNEPWCTAMLGYLWGVHAPGVKDLDQAIIACRNLLLAHGHAVRILREMTADAEVGITLNMTAQHSDSESEEDLRAAERGHAFNNTLFADPLYLGEWPRELQEAWNHPEAWELTDEQWRLITQKTDFLGLNYYTRQIVRNAPGQQPIATAAVANPGADHTDMGWEIYPQGLFELLEMIRDRYENPPVYITENGAAFPDPPDNQGNVEDHDRIQYLKAHFDQALQAIRADVNLRGYFVWSLMDNFEWAFGYSKRFGIVRVNFENQTRTPKVSARWFSDFLSKRG